jgi:hypothetical protein
MKRETWIMVALGALAAAAVGAQETPRERAQRLLPPAVFEELSTLASSVEPSGIPPGPLFAKALEGAAKRVPPERLVPAVREYAGRLGEARDALGPTAGVPLLVAGADALQRGVSPSTLRSIPADRPRSPMALLMLAELVESGVPVDRALAVVREAMAQRARDERMLDVSARVRLLIRQGVAPRDALERARMLLREGGNVGPALPPGSEPITRDRPRLRP